MTVIALFEIIFEAKKPLSKLKKSCLSRAENIVDKIGHPRGENLAFKLNVSFTGNEGMQCYQMTV